MEKGTSMDTVTNRAGFLTHLIWLHLFGELSSPKSECLLQCQPNTLEEESILQPPKVPQVVVSPQGFVQVAHAGRKGFPSKL